MTKFYYICRQHFSGKENKEYFIINFYSEDDDCIINSFVEQSVFNNYNNVKPFTEISNNKVSVVRTKNKYGQIVVSYKINN